MTNPVLGKKQKLFHQLDILDLNSIRRQLALCTRLGVGNFAELRGIGTLWVQRLQKCEW